jgi:hypothetical protein
VGASCVFASSVAAQSLTHQQTLGDGIVVQIIGEANHQGLKIMRDGRKIYKNMLNDGIITLKCVQASKDGKRYNIAARFGSHGNLYKTYAVVGDKVLPSPKYRNTANGDKNIPADWITPDQLQIKGTQPNTISFDPVSEKWRMAKGIILQ